MPVPSWARGSLLAAAVALCSGCGGAADGRVPVVPVQGKVLVRGQPAAGALVIFHPVGAPDANTPRPTAVAADDGTFILSTYDTGDGAPAGSYLVTVTWDERDEEADDGVPGVDRLRGRYADPSQSGLRVEVQSGTNELPPFDLDR
jgi:hypothetical protein